MHNGKKYNQYFAILTFDSSNNLSDLLQKRATFDACDLQIKLARIVEKVPSSVGSFNSLIKRSCYRL